MQRADLGLPASRYLFFGGFLFSRFGAFLFPMHTVSHIRAILTTEMDFEPAFVNPCIPFDAFPQCTLE